jgi:uncharacterized membrane protein
MNTQQYRYVRVAVIFFMAAVVAVSLWLNNHLLAAAGIVTGLLFLLLVRSRARILVDEREQSIREKAAAATYTIYAATIGVSAVILLLWSRSGFVYLEALGLLFAYLALFLIALYAISYQFFNRRYGGGGDEE